MSSPYPSLSSAQQHQQLTLAPFAPLISLPNPLRAPFASAAQLLPPVNSGSPWAATSRPPLHSPTPSEALPVLACTSQPPAASQRRPRNPPDQHRPPLPPAHRGPVTSITPASPRPYGWIPCDLVKLPGLLHATSDHWTAAPTTHLHRRPPALPYRRYQPPRTNSKHPQVRKGSLVLPHPSNPAAGDRRHRYTPVKLRYPCFEPERISG
jgi:hypothetical protein